VGIASTHVVLRVPRLRRYPVKTWTWVTRCSGSAHRNDGSPEAFIVLQVYYDRAGIGRPHRLGRSIRLPRGRPPHFPSRLFAWLLPYHRGKRSANRGSQVHLSIREKEKFQIYMTPYAAEIFLWSTHQAAEKRVFELSSREERIFFVLNYITLEEKLTIVSSSRQRNLYSPGSKSASTSTHCNGIVEATEAANNTQD